jgi:hypothetical protein
LKIFSKLKISQQKLHRKITVIALLKAFNINEAKNHLKK